MIIDQLSVFMENKSGRLTEITKVLSSNSINISALTVAETEDFGILRLIVDNPEKAIECLKANNLSVQTTDVICIITPDTPGALHDVLEYLSDASINVSYMYGYSHENVASNIMKVSDPVKAVEILQSKKVELISKSQFYSV